MLPSTGFNNRKQSGPGGKARNDAVVAGPAHPGLSQTGHQPAAVVEAAWWWRREVASRDDGVF